MPDQLLYPVSRYFVRGQRPRISSQKLDRRPAEFSSALEPPDDELSPCNADGLAEEIFFSIRRGATGRRLVFPERNESDRMW